MSAAAEPLVDYLRQLERQGQTHVHLDENAKVVLREFYKRAKGVGQSPQVAQKVAPQPVETSVPQPAARPLAPQASEALVVQAMATNLDALGKQIAADGKFKALGSLREKMVFSEGDSSADIMVVGEAPSYHDESKAAPFSGPAGKKMEAILKAMGLARNEVYLTNLVKFRPAMANQTTNTRKPNKAEIEASMAYFVAEMKLVKPKVIIVLGATAAKSLLHPRVEVKDMLGKFHEFEDVKVRATYHPSYLLHQEVTPEKRAVWVDMMAIMELLEMPISEKQRGYFKKK